MPSNISTFILLLCIKCILRKTNTYTSNSSFDNDMKVCFQHTGYPAVIRLMRICHALYLGFVNDDATLISQVLEETNLEFERNLEHFMNADAILS